MVVAFVLITTSPGAEREVFSKLTEMKQIVELYTLFGEYDLIARVEADSMNDVGQLVVDKIRSIEGISETKTLTGANL